MPLDTSLPTTSSQAAVLADVKFSVFPNKFCTGAPALKIGSLAALAKMIKETLPAAKEALPFIKLAQFNGERNPKPAPGTKLPSYRYDAGVVKIYGVEGDYDGGKVTMAEAARMLNAAGIEALLYSSPSSTPLAPRWRVLAPTAVPVLRPDGATCSPGSTARLAASWPVRASRSARATTSARRPAAQSKQSSPRGSE